MKTTIYQFGTDRFYSDKKLKNLLTLTKERTLKIDDKEISLTDCDPIDLSIYHWSGKHYQKAGGVGKYQELRLDTDNNRLFVNGDWNPMENLKEAIIEKDKSPFPKKSYKWLWWIIGIFAFILLVFVLAKVVADDSENASANSPEQTENTVRTDEEEVPVGIEGFD